MPLQDYEILCKVGSGKYASVYRIRRLSDGTYFAMKKIQLTRMNLRERTNALSEVRLLSAIRHPNIVALVEVFYDEFIESLCLVLELAEDGDLSTAITQRTEQRSTFSEEQVWGIVQQVSRGLDFLHSHAILHRDIKASNILIFRNGTYKIGDLNVSKLDNGLSYTRTGTLTYASPEVWKGDRYDSKCDLWSLGCLLYELLTLSKPFEGENIEQISKKILKGQFQKIATDTYSRELRDLPTFLLQLNPKLRPSAATLLKIVKNKCWKPENDLQRIVSFNLASVKIPGLDSSLQSKQVPLLHSNTSLEYNIFKRQTMSRHKHYLAPIPTSLRPIKESETGSQSKSRYNCRHLSKLPSFNVQNSNLQEISKEDILIPPLKNASNILFKRIARNNNIKLLRRNTEL